MIDTDILHRVIGADVYDADGDKIGTASEVYLDDRSGAPEWVTVKTGLFGTKESFVPLRDADLTGDGLRVRVSKDAVKDAPKVDTDGHLSPDEEQELYRYYDISGDISGDIGGDIGGGQRSGETSGQTTGRTTDVDDYTLAGTGRTTTNTGLGAGVTDPTGDTAATTNAGYNEIPGNDGTTDGAMTPSEERVDVGTERTGAGRARLSKYVVTEDVTKARDALGPDDRR